MDKIKQKITKKLFSRKYKYDIINTILWYKEENGFDSDFSMR